MFDNALKPVKTKDTQGEFGGDMPYRFLLTNLGACVVVTWKASFIDRIKFLFKGTITVQTYQQTQPPMVIRVGEDV